MKRTFEPLTPEELAEIERRRAAARERLRQRPPLTDEEDARLTAAAEADPDALPMTGAELRRMRPAHEVVPHLVARQLRRERAEAAGKVEVTLQLDPEVVEAFKAGGPDWQNRMTAVLRRGARRQAVPAKAKKAGIGRA